MGQSFVPEGATAAAVTPPVRNVEIRSDLIHNYHQSVGATPSHRSQTEKSAYRALASVSFCEYGGIGFMIVDHIDDVARCWTQAPGALRHVFAVIILNTSKQQKK